MPSDDHPRLRSPWSPGDRSASWTPTPEISPCSTRFRFRVCLCLLCPARRFVRGPGSEAWWRSVGKADIRTWKLEQQLSRMTRRTLGPPPSAWPERSPSGLSTAYAAAPTAWQTNERPFLLWRVGIALTEDSSHRYCAPGLWTRRSAGVDAVLSPAAERGCRRCRLVQAKRPQSRRPRRAGLQIQRHGAVGMGSSANVSETRKVVKLYEFEGWSSSL